MKTVQNAHSTQALTAPPVQQMRATEQIMDSAETPEQKKAALMTLFSTGTDETLTKAVDYFYENPRLFSKTVIELAAVTTQPEKLKAFLKKIADVQGRIIPFMHEHFETALKATTWSEYKAALTPCFALKETFEGADKNRRAAKSCPSAFDLLRTFNDVNARFTLLYAPFMYKKIGSLDMDK